MVLKFELQSSTFSLKGDAMIRTLIDTVTSVKVKNPIYFLFFVVAIAIVITLWQGANSTRNLIKNNQLNEEIIHTQLNNIEQDIGQRLGNNAISLYIIAHSPILKRYAENSFEYFQDLQTLFYALIKSNPDIYQIRFIDSSGNEAIRVEDIENQLIFTPEEQLQFKGNRDYFKESSLLPLEQIYVSPIDLNKEKGEVVKPWMPTIRLATPIYSKAKLFTGVLIINIHADWIFETYNTSGLAQKYDVFTVNNDGYWLSGKPDSQLWGFMFDQESTIDKEFPETWTQILQPYRKTFNAHDKLWSTTTIKVSSLFPNSLSFSAPEEVLWRAVISKPTYSITEISSALLPYGIITLIFLAIGHVLWTLIQDKKNTENELIKSERLSSLGGLVAGVAHELNTPIGSAITTASTINAHALEIRESIEKGQIKKSRIYEFTKDMEYAGNAILNGLNRADILISQFKQIAVDQTGELSRKFALDSYIEEMSGTFAHLFKHKKITLRLKLKSNATMNSYPGALSQVIINLVQNALIHGFEENEEGLITIQTEKINQQDVCLRITDTGKGIPTEIISKIFDPFFTTRLGQGGSGLGLHITHNIVTNILHGLISVESSTKHHFTEFKIIMPLEMQHLNTNEHEMKKDDSRPAA